MKRISRRLLSVGLLVAGMFVCTMVVQAGDLYFDVNFVPNIFFDKYNVNLSLDGELVETITHGENFTKLLNDIADGEHEIVFSKEDDSSVKGSIGFSMKGDTTIQCRISCYSSEVDIDKINILDNTDLSAIEVPNMYGEPLSAAKEELKELGFTEISGKAEDDSIWDDDNWTVIEQNIESGDTVDKNTEIILTCVKTQGYLEGFLLDSNIPETKEQEEDLGYQFEYYNKLTKADMNPMLETMPEETAMQWVVREIEHSSSGKREADLRLIFTGNKVMPDVIDATLKDALDYLKENDFSEVNYVTTKDSVWNENNWIVIEQDIPAGEIIKADSKINLTVKHKDLFEEEGVEIPSKKLSGYDDSLNTTAASEVELLPDDEKGEDVSASLDSVVAEPEETELVETESIIETPDEPTASEAESIPELSGETEGTEQESSDSDYIIIAQGSKGSDVESIQKALIDKGFLDGNADGSFGPKTHAAVMAFQAEHELEATGVVDETTYILLMKTEDQNQSVESSDAGKVASFPEVKRTSNSVGYSTNDKKSAKEGKSGVYAYKNRGGVYDSYYVIDFDAGNVYFFTDGNADSTCDVVKIVSGTLNDYVLITYHDAGDEFSFGLHFKYVNQPDHLVIQDEDGFTYDYYSTNLDSAIRIRNTKRARYF